MSEIRFVRVHCPNPDCSDGDTGYHKWESLSRVVEQTILQRRWKMSEKERSARVELTKEEIRQVTHNLLEREGLLGQGIEIVYEFDQPMSTVIFKGCSDELATRLRPILLRDLLSLYIQKTSEHRVIYGDVTIKGF